MPLDVEKTKPDSDPTHVTTKRYKKRKRMINLRLTTEQERADHSPTRIALRFQQFVRHIESGFPVDHLLDRVTDLQVPLSARWRQRELARMVQDNRAHRKVLYSRPSFRGRMQDRVNAFARAVEELDLRLSAP